MQNSSEREIQKTYQGGEIAKKYIQERFESSLGQILHKGQVASVNQLISRIQPRRTLEIAPGPGRVTREIMAAGELVCLEYNQGMIDVGRAACGRHVRWVQGNAFQMPFNDEFDFVYSFRFVRHFHQEDRNRLYQQIAKVLRPGGYFLMDAVNGQVSAPLRKEKPEAYPIYDKLYREVSELRSELGEAGLEVLSIEPVQRWYSLQYQAQVLLGPRSRLLCRWVIRALEQLRRGPALEWIVTCRRA